MSAEIKVELIAPPIPVRQWDWCAWRDGSLEDGPRGWGASSAEAVADLLEQEEELAAHLAVWPEDEKYYISGPGTADVTRDTEPSEPCKQTPVAMPGPAQILPGEKP